MDCSVWIVQWYFIFEHEEEQLLKLVNAMQMCFFGGRPVPALLLRQTLHKLGSIHANHKHKLRLSPVADRREEKQKIKNIPRLRIPVCSLRWKLHVKLTFVAVVGTASVLNAGAGAIVVLKKTDGDGDEKTILVFPQRPTLLHPLGVRPMFCKFQADEAPALSPVTSKKAMK